MKIGWKQEIERPRIKEQKALKWRGYDEAWPNWIKKKTNFTGRAKTTSFHFKWNDAFCFKGEEHANEASRKTMLYYS